MKKLTHEQIVARQVEQSRQPRIKLAVVLNDIRSLHNVGSIFRTADGLGVEKLWLCGITGYPPQAGLSKIALGAEDAVSWEYQKDMLMVVKQYKEQGYQIVVLEQLQESISHDTFKPAEKVCLIVGNEIDGVSDEVLSLCDVALEIDMAGLKNSLNVGVAFGVAGYHLRQFMKMVD